ncbi:hypothetical protein [Halorubrum salinum]|uniref:hypothetical protein n=1 Tax=Halorubrum salinum TaxID=767517 RepID=UPI0021120E8B|nr:hypothetical protein [Halorubrum salinum]
MPHDPLSPSEALSTPVGAALGAVSLLALAYSVVIAAQILLGLIAVALLSVGPYLGYRLLAALDSVADAAQRIAEVREREADEVSRFDRHADRETPRASEQSSDRATERER